MREDTKKLILKTSLEPHGVIFKIAAQNFPVWIALKNGIANMLLGNTFLLRSTESCLLVQEELENIFKSNQNLESILNVAYCPKEDVEKIIAMH